MTVRGIWHRKGRNTAPGVLPFRTPTILLHMLLLLQVPLFADAVALDLDRVVERAVFADDNEEDNAAQDDAVRCADVDDELVDNGNEEHKVDKE